MNIVKCLPSNRTISPSAQVLFFQNNQNEMSNIKSDMYEQKHIIEEYNLLHNQSFYHQMKEFLNTFLRFTYNVNNMKTTIQQQQKKLYNFNYIVFLLLLYSCFHIINIISEPQKRI